MATPAQVNQRTRAGSSPKKPREPQVLLGTADEPVVILGDLSSPDDFDIDAKMGEYRSIVGDPTSWTECKAMEQVRYEMYKTRLAARDDQKARGQLMAIADVRARDEAKALIFRRALNSVPDLLAKWVAPDKILAAQAEAREWADETLRRVADEVAQ